MNIIRERLKTRKLFKDILKILKPPKKQTISEWADNYRILSKEASSEPGKWETSRAPYLKEMMDCIIDPEVENVTQMLGTQLGKTESQLNILDYFIVVDPCSILYILPSDVAVKEFSKERVDPMIRDNPMVNKKITHSTLSHKSFTGGFVAMIGANSPSKLASKPIRVILADELDRYTQSSGDEGDPLSLAMKRTATFWNRKIIAVSSPTIKGKSLIEKRYESSSKGRWYIHCPSCGELNTYDFKRLDFETHEMSCKECGVLHPEYEWKDQKGGWVHEIDNKSHRGFHLNEMASPFKTWGEIIKDFKDAKNDPNKLKVFVNTSLAETWEETYEEIIDWKKLYKSREKYEAEIPDGVLVLTAGVDVQNDRIECEVIGWGLGKESWGIKYVVFPGNPGEEDVWNQLDRFLTKKFYFKDGVGINIASTCIDTGGHYTEETYNYISPIQNHRRTYGVKGQGKEGVPILNGYRRTKNNKIDLLSIGVNALKDTTMGRLKLKKGPGTCHFPLEREYGEDYFKSLTAEIKKTKNGKIVWEKIRERNEGLDLRNYGTAAYEIIVDLDLEMISQMDREELTAYYEFKRSKYKNKA